MRQGRFEGWYFKQQCGGRTVAFIPARHRGRDGEAAASLQIVTDGRAWNLDLPAEAFRVERDPFTVRAGKCVFGLEGCRIDCDAGGRSFRGELCYSAPVRPAYDIMGPFRFVPALQCRHSLVSLTHRVDGGLLLDGERLEFRDGAGYIEGDRGRSFPSRYLWTHCAWAGNSVMLSVADIPFCGGRFTGCISAAYVDGREVRLATYLGARPERVDGRGAVLRQGPYRLLAELEEERPLSLRAPQQGGMGRTIRESLACRVRYLLQKGGETLFSLTSDEAGFESEWPEE